MKVYNSLVIQNSFSYNKKIQGHEEMAYYEICDAIHNKGWTVYKTSQAMGPYTVSPATRPGRVTMIRTWQLLKLITS